MAEPNDAQEKNAEFVKNWLATSDIELAADTVKEWLDDHPETRDEIVRKHQLCPEIMMARLRERKLSFSHPPPSVPKEAEVIKRKSSNAEQGRKSVTELKQLDKNEMFMELLRNIVSPDFDVNSISYKILLNVLLLTNADRSSLFLAEGSGENAVLVSRLFDVSENSTLESSLHDEADAIKIPINNKSIVGTVASTGEPLNLLDAYSDPRFNTKVDKLTGYKTNTILCMPIKASDGQLLGVAQVINKKGKIAHFVEEDQEVFKLYLNFCGIALVNTQLFNNSFNLSTRLEVLLQTTRELFRDTSSLEVMMGKIMEQAHHLVPCEKVELLLVEEQTTDSEDIKFKTAFSYRAGTLQTFAPTEFEEHELILALQVASSGKVINHAGTKSSNVKDAISSYLYVPIYRRGEVIGVLKVTNKENGLPFNLDEQESFVVFAAFCGLGIHNVMNYETILKISAKQTVALEVLSYHASASEDDTTKLMKVELPTSESLQLAKFSFDDQLLSEDETVLGAVRIFVECDFIKNFRIDTKVLYRWVLTVKKNYRAVTYHNWRHAFNVAQSMFTIFKTGRLCKKFTDMEQLALIVGCLCHDLDHRGTNNAFQAKVDSPLAFLYSTSTMEHHHFDHCIMILNSTGNNIFSGLDADEYQMVLRLLEGAILSTDLAVSFQNRDKFTAHVQDKTLDWSTKEHRDLIRGMMMTACDVAAISKPWHVQHRVAELVASEFFEQGDKERNNLKLEPIPMMDRNKKNELPSMQVGFITYVCQPLYQTLAVMSDDLRPLLDGAIKNKSRWESMVVKKPEEDADTVTDKTLETPETPKTPVDTETSVTLVPVHSATPVDSNSPVTLTPVHTATQGAIDIPVTLSPVHTTAASDDVMTLAPATTQGDKPHEAGSTKRDITPRGLADARPIEAWRGSDTKGHNESQQESEKSQKRKCSAF